MTTHTHIVYSHHPTISSLSLPSQQPRLKLKSAIIIKAHFIIIYQNYVTLHYKLNNYKILGTNSPIIDTVNC